MTKIMIVVMAGFLTGCVNLKIRAELPKVDLYVLEPNTKTKASEYKCKSYENIAILGVLSTEIYETKQILMRSSDGKIKALKDKQWADIPRNLFKNLLVEQANEHCIFLSSPPFGSTVPKKMLRLNLFSFVLEDSPQVQARVILGYEFFIGEKKISGILNETQETSKTQDDPIKAFQKASKQVVNNLINLTK